MSAAVVLAAGGTGGHLFPAQALARTLRDRGHRLTLVTDARGGGYGDMFDDIDVEVVAAATPSGRGPLGRVAALRDIARGVGQARRLLKRLRAAVVVGFGGYPALPTMLAAISLRLPTLIHEQNAVLGRVNRLLAPFVTAIAASFARTAGVRPRHRGKVTVTGNPVRPEIGRIAERDYAPPGPGEAIRLLVFGGSQGASVLSEVVPAAILALDQDLTTRIGLTQQCRPDDCARVAALYRAAGIEATVEAFFDDLPDRLAAAHLVIARAGAGTVSELAVAGRPAILVPYQHATDDHQTANAENLVAVDGAVVLAQRTLAPADLSQRLDELLRRPDRLAALARNVRGAGHGDAADRLADLAEATAGGRTGGAPA